MPERFVSSALRKLLALSCCCTALALPPAAGAAAPAQDGWVTLPTVAYPKKRDDVVFATPQVGYYGTGMGQLYRTEDGGQHWQLIWNHSGTFIRSLGFLDAQHGFLGNLGIGLAQVTDNVPLYRTADGGQTWQPVESAAGTIVGVCAIDILHSRAILEGDVRERVIIHAAGRANGPAQLLRSEDAGEHWTPIDLSHEAGMILDVKFLDPETGFVFAGTSSDVAQSSALILRTTNGGRTWQTVYRSPRQGEIIWKSAFPSDKVAYATVQSDDSARAQQRIVKSIDGGRHWQELPLVRNAQAQEFGIGFADAQHGWVGTAAGGLETLDGGHSWRPSTLAARANKIRTHSADGQSMIYAIGTEVQLLH